MDEVLKLAAVLGVAALPWGEVFFAIPLGIGLGLPAVVTFVVSVVGNVASVAILVRVVGRWEQVRHLLLRGRRAKQAERLMNRYGVAGLAAQAPLISGTHAAVLVGLLLGVRTMPLTLWMTVSIAGWGVAVTVLSAQGRQLALGLFS